MKACLLPGVWGEGSGGTEGSQGQYWGAVSGFEALCPAESLLAHGGGGSFSKS